MKYVKQGEVVKEVADHLAGDYVSAGWKTATKEDFESASRVQPQTRRPPIDRNAE